MFLTDDSSRRAVQNAFALIHGLNLPSKIYRQYNFSSQLKKAKRSVPKFHLLPKNRLTQYMGPASAYDSVLRSIDDIISSILSQSPDVFSFHNLSDGIVEIRDFQTTGVVAFAFGMPFTVMTPGYYPMLPNKKTQIHEINIQNCLDAMNQLINKL